MNVQPNILSAILGGAVITPSETLPYNGGIRTSVQVCPYATTVESLTVPRWPALEAPAPLIRKQW